MWRKRRKTTESERWQSDAEASKDTLERLRSAHRAFTRVRNYAEERGFGELWRGVFRAPLFLFIFYICTQTCVFLGFSLPAVFICCVIYPFLRARVQEMRLAALLVRGKNGVFLVLVSSEVFFFWKVLFFWLRFCVFIYIIWLRIHLDM